MSLGKVVDSFGFTVSEDIPTESKNSLSRTSTYLIALSLTGISLAGNVYADQKCEERFNRLANITAQTAELLLRCEKFKETKPSAVSVKDNSEKIPESIKKYMDKYGDEIWIALQAQYFEPDSPYAISEYEGHREWYASSNTGLGNTDYECNDIKCQMFRLTDLMKYAPDAIPETHLLAALEKMDYHVDIFDVDGARKERARRGHPRIDEYWVDFWRQELVKIYPRDAYKVINSKVFDGKYDGKDEAKLKKKDPDFFIQASSQNKFFFDKYPQSKLFKKASLKRVDPTPPIKK